MREAKTQVPGLSQAGDGLTTPSSFVPFPTPKISERSCFHPGAEGHFSLTLKKSHFLLSSTLIGPSTHHLKKATRKSFSSAVLSGEEMPTCLQHED